MLRAVLIRTGSGPLLLAFVGLVAVHLMLLVSSARAPRPWSPFAAESASAPAAESPAPALADPGPRREPVLGLGRGTDADEVDDGAAPRAKAKPRGARKEREFLAGFLALAREQPGELEALAARVLAGDGPPAEKVALLRALERSGSSERVRWLEHAVCTLPDDSGPHGISVASFALGELVATAPADRAARQSLWHVAFEARALAPGLRRSAAAGFARGGEDRELGALRVVLARESDELLVAGVLAALRERPECPMAVRLLDELSPPPTVQ